MPDTNNYTRTGLEKADWNIALAVMKMNGKAAWSVDFVWAVRWDQMEMFWIDWVSHSDMAGWSVRVEMHLYTDVRVSGKTDFYLSLG